MCEPEAVAFAIEYDHPRVLATIEAWAIDAVAHYARFVELRGTTAP